jgi:hypothetical protein
MKTNGCIILVMTQSFCDLVVVVGIEYRPHGEQELQQEDGKTTRALLAAGFPRFPSLACAGRGNGWEEGSSADVTGRSGSKGRACAFWPN